MAEGAEARQYGTLEGMFVPTLLTILGVILFLRTGWVMGNAGLLGGVGIIVMAFVITGSTASSLASISTNVTPESGGAYSLVARSFGVEAGGAVGLSLYLPQSLVIVLYTFGFRDGWLAIFPRHPPLAVDVATVAALIIVTLVGTKAVVTGVASAADTDGTERYLDEVAEQARLPGPPEIHVIQRPFADALDVAPSANCTCSPCRARSTSDGYARRERLATPCLFVRDSGVENAFA